MKKDVAHLVEQGDELGIPPRSRPERQRFASWLSSALTAAGLSALDLATETGVEQRDIDAMIETESNGTAKADRECVHEFVLSYLREIGQRGPVPHRTDPSARIEDVISRRAEFAAFFSPKDDLKQAITRVIGAAKQEIRIQAWQLTCKKILESLANSRAKSIDIVISTAGESAALRRLAEVPRIRVFHDPARKNHNKTIVVDRALALTGSVNFNYGSGCHDENLLITSRAEVVDAYWHDFETKRKRLRRVRA